jgi:hypothetical protein
MYEWFAEYGIWVVIGISIMYGISTICLHISEHDAKLKEEFKCKDQKGIRKINNVGIVLMILTLFSVVSCVLIVLFYLLPIQLEKKADVLRQQYIYSITDFDTSAPEGMNIVKRYTNMEDFKHYKVYGEDAGYTLYKVDNKGYVVEVTFKKND